MGTTLGPPAEKLWPLLDELLAPLLLPLLPLVMLVPPPPPHAVKTRTASSRVQRQALGRGTGAIPIRPQRRPLEPGSAQTPCLEMYADARWPGRQNRIAQCSIGGAPRYGIAPPRRCGMVRSNCRTAAADQAAWALAR